MFDIIEKLLKDYQYTVNGFVAIGTCASVVVALWLARSKPEPKLKLSLFSSSADLKLKMLNSSKIAAYLDCYSVYLHVPVVCKWLFLHDSCTELNSAPTNHLIVVCPHSIEVMPGRAKIHALCGTEKLNEAFNKLKYKTIALYIFKISWLRPKVRVETATNENFYAKINGNVWSLIQKHLSTS